MAHLEKLADSTIYPSLFGLLSTSLPVLHKMQPRVFRALRHYARLSGADARAALTYESDAPVIRVAELPPKYAFYPGSGDVIILQWSFVQDVESAHRSGFAKVLRLLESKILHEMVHWGWFKATLSRYEPPSRYGFRDYAWDFEKDAYGTTMTVKTLGLEEVIPDPNDKRSPAMSK
jgi:hypothetical protein